MLFPPIRWPEPGLGTEALRGALAEYPHVARKREGVPSSEVCSHFIITYYGHYIIAWYVLIINNASKITGGKYDTTDCCCTILNAGIHIFFKREIKKISIALSIYRHV